MCSVGCPDVAFPENSPDPLCSASDVGYNDCFVAVVLLTYILS